tara:strand:+ start:2261 stop:2494 length:234 start_codon:yes stop_codon:yes gene_type:complete
MEAQPPYSIVSTILQPTSFAFPPDGEVSVAPQIVQEIMVVALENMIDSEPQSLHDTFMKFPDIYSPHLSTNSNFFAL